MSTEVLALPARGPAGLAALLRTAFRALLLLAAAATFAATLLPRLGHHARLLDLFAFVQPQLALLALGLLGLALLARHRLAALAAALAAAASLVALWPAVPHAAAGHSLRVVTLNVLYTNENTDAVLGYLRRTAADIVVLQEMNAEWTKRLEALTDRYPHWTAGAGSTNLIMSRLPLHDDRALPKMPQELDDPNAPIRAVVSLGGREVAIYVAHPDTPRSQEQWTKRNGYLAWLAARMNELDADRLRILAGDLNTPPTSVWYRDLLRTAELADSGGGGLRWPTRLYRRWPQVMRLIGAPVDHILASPEIGVVRSGTGDYVGSDHLPLMAELRIPDAAAQPSAASPAL